MSLSPSPYSIFDYSHPYFSVLNAEAAPFSPSVSSGSPLRASAPVFVAPVAPTVTPHPPIQPESETLEVQALDTLYDSGDCDFMQSGVMHGRLNWDITSFTPNTGDDILDFSTAYQSAGAQLEDPHGALSGLMSPRPEGFQYATAALTLEEPQCSQACVVGEYDVVSSIERDFDLEALGTPPMSEHGFAMYPPGGVQRFTEPSTGRTQELDSGDDSDIDGDYDIDDEYQPPAQTSPRESVASTDQCPTPESIAESDEPSFAEKQKRANIIIKQQAKEQSLAKRLGQDIRIVRKGNRVCFEGVYWNAPKNDHTIPTTEAHEYTCVQKLVAAMRNNKGCKEVATAKMFLNRWADDATHYAMEEFESIAWDIVDAMVGIHTKGWTKKLLDQKLRDQVQKTMFCTFGERFDALIKLLKTSKRTCEDLLKSERFYTTIGNPFELDVRTSSNRNSNRNKAVKLKRDAGEMEGGEDLGASASRRTKRARV